MNENNDMVSVVIPMFGVEKYIHECLTSIINQTHKNLEILCIDDCSQDNSVMIAEDFSKRDHRIKIIRHKENAGQGKARNTGIENAEGKYIYFIDGDDFIDLDYIEKLVTNITKTRSDIVCNNKMLKYYADTPSKNKFIRKEGDFVLDKKLVSEGKFLEKMLISPCCKLYRVDFLKDNNIYFAEGLKFEDFYFFYVLKTKVESISFTYNSTYYYRQRKKSTMDLYSRNRNNFYDSLYIVAKIYEFYEKNNLLDKHSVPFSWLNKFFKKQNNKEAFFQEIRENFFAMRDSVIWDKVLHNRGDKFFFNCVLNSKSYFSFRIKYTFLKLIR